MEWMDKIKDFKLAVNTIVMVVAFVIASYKLYAEIHKKIDDNKIAIEKKIAADTKQLEITQISILKSLKTALERYPCKTSIDGWAEYNMIFGQYWALRKKHNSLLNIKDMKPIERLSQDSCKCYKGDEGGCSE